MYSFQMKHDINENLLKKIASALTGIDADSSISEKPDEHFCVEETLASADIKVMVKDVGELSFPLSKECIHKLINVSTTAKFGMGEKTVVDPNVRNTQVIESKNLNVTINEDSLSRITSNIQKALDLPVGGILKPHLRNMLIYGPGQFFNKHRDSEKLQNMVASLVIILPSPHVGGDLIIEHGKKEHIFSTENVDEENAKCICFYSDCLHKVNKVKGGHRIALTFNVILETGELLDIPCTNNTLKSAVRDYFDTVIVEDRYKKIVFFLNHAYSEHSLRWNLLKGEDYLYAFNLRSVAKELDLNIYLTLADIRQCWSSVSEDEAVPDWLVESESTLNCWVDANNVRLPYEEYFTTMSEICYARETHYINFVPVEEDFSGPTGNEGATIDYWYKRASVVLWQKSDSMMIHFEVNYDGAVTYLHTLINVPGNEGKVKYILDKVNKFLCRRPTAENFEKFVNIAVYVKSKKDALAILSPFSLKVLIPKNVPMLVQLQQHYGIDWLIELLGVLRRTEKIYSLASNSSMNYEAINTFVLQFLSSGGDRSVMEFLVNAEVTTFIETSEKSVKWKIYTANKGDNLQRPRELLKICATIGNVALQEKLVQHLTLHRKLYPRNELVQLYHQLQKTLKPENSDNFELLRTPLVEAVKQELSLQTRPTDDWSISTDLYCNCEYCNVLANFLHSNSVSKSWSVSGKICNHMMAHLKHRNIPVEITIECESNAFTVVLVKKASLHTEAAKKCSEITKMLQTLELKTDIEEGHEDLMKNDVTKCQEP